MIYINYLHLTWYVIYSSFKYVIKSTTHGYNADYIKEAAEKRRLFFG
jgi:hypothetical protein